MALWIDLWQAHVDMLHFQDHDDDYDLVFGYNSPLLSAMTSGDISAIDYILNKGVDMNDKNKTGNSELHVAVTKQNSTLELIRQLLEEQPILINSRNKFLRTPLHLAVKYNMNLDIVKELLRSGADVHARDRCDLTPLHVVAHYDNPHQLSLFQILIEHGANVNARSWALQTPLHLTISNEVLHYNSIQFLLSKGSDPHAVDVKGNTILKVALNNSATTVDVLKMLLEFGARPECRLLNGQPEIKFAKLIIQYIVIKKFERAFWSIEEFSLASLSNLILDLEFCTTFKSYVTWSTFKDACVNEISEMRKDKLSQNCSLFHFVYKQCSTVMTDEAYLDLSLIDQVLFRLKSGKYPCCKDLLLISLKRPDLLAKLSELDIYTKSSPSVGKTITRKISLNYYTISKLVRYLSRKDLTNLILAYTSDLEQEMPTSWEIPLSKPIKRRNERLLDSSLSLKHLKLG